MTKPNLNLNDVRTRIQYMLDGGKVRRKSWQPHSYIHFYNNDFKWEDGIRTTFFVNVCDGWEPYEEPKSEEDLRKEFVSTFGDAAADHKFNLAAQIIFDTFELRKKS